MGSGRTLRAVVGVTYGLTLGVTQMTERANDMIELRKSTLPGRSDLSTGREGPRHSRGGLRRRLLVAVAFGVLTVIVGTSSAPAVDAGVPRVDGVHGTGSRPTITAGNAHSCALTAAGGVRCWGSNARGQLGDGTTTERTTPVDVVGLGSPVRTLDAGWNFTCAVTRSGGVKCWGYNGQGQLGNGTTTDSLTPSDVAGLASGVTAISAGVLHACALTTRGGVVCWGRNDAGQLGDGTTSDRLTPVDVAGLGSGVVAISAGVRHTCAVTRQGAVMCWGANNAGELGDGTTTGRLTPVKVVGLPGRTTAVAAGTGEPTLEASHTCAVTTPGRVMCWGLNWGGQLGDGTTTDSPTPVQVAGLRSGIGQIAAGGTHTCALTRRGGVKCWGYNGQGQLGDGTTTDSRTPVQVAGLQSGIAQIAAGDIHTCALTRSGGVKCWGYNGSAQLGDGTYITRLTPVDVSGSFNRRECPTLLAAPHTSFTLSRGYAVGSVATFTADSGYALVGRATLRCRGDRSWSGPVPTAEGTGSVTVTPATGLVDGQTVTVTMSGFPASGTVGWCQGVPVEPASTSNCGGPVRTGQTDASGGLIDPSYPVARFIFVPTLGRTVDCAAETCVIGAADVTDIPGSVANAYLAFSVAEPSA